MVRQQEARKHAADTGRGANQCVALCSTVSAVVVVAPREWTRPMTFLKPTDLVKGLTSPWAPAIVICTAVAFMISAFPARVAIKRWGLARKRQSSAPFVFFVAAGVGSVALTTVVLGFEVVMRIMGSWSKISWSDAVNAILYGAVFGLVYGCISLILKAANR